MFYMELGIAHVLDIRAYDHMLFLIVLVVSFSLKQWKNILWLVSVFTAGHTVSLALSAYNIIDVDASLIEFFIPLTIFLTALKHLLSGVKTTSNSKVLMLLSFCFGCIHGMGFARYFNMLVVSSDTKALNLLEFSLGIEIAQLIIVVVVVLLYHLITPLLKISKRDWVLVISSVVIGVTIPMLLTRYNAFAAYLF